MPELCVSRIITLSCYFRSSAGGVVRCFVSAGVVGGGRDTAARSVAELPGTKHIEKLKKDIVRRKKGRRLIERLKTAVEWDWPKKMKEYWMIQVQHTYIVALK